MTRKRHLTARIKPATKHALMAQLALAADEIERLRGHVECLRIVARSGADEAAVWQRQVWIMDRCLDGAQRRWWHRFAWWRK